ncbi:MAG: cell division protein SepF [Acidimicrobiia bacterium]
MASLWQRTLYYLGLVDEDQAEEAAWLGADQPQSVRTVQNERGRSRLRGTDQASDSNRIAGRRIEPPMAARRQAPGESALAEAGVIVHPSEGPSAHKVSPSTLESEVIVARSYADAQLLADDIRANIPVVLDLREVEPAMVRRLVDFASGLTYALGGLMRKIGQGVILITPANVNISRDERRRLIELGYYQAPDA